MDYQRKSGGQILAELDTYLHKNDYVGAEKYLLALRQDAEESRDLHTLVTVFNEMMGLYRKLGRESEAIVSVDAALDTIARLGAERQIGSATTYLNSATVYKAFGRVEQALPLFYQAREIYENKLSPDDKRLGGLYNNMGLALVDAGRFEEAYELYAKAIEVMERHEDGAPEVAITYLNMASAAEAQLGLEAAEEKIQEYLSAAEALLESHQNRDGYYAFVCEKCASVFGYYGHFFYEKELTERARRIYEGA